MVTNASLVSRIEAIERELALIKQELQRSWRGPVKATKARKAKRLIMKGKVDIEDVKYALFAPIDRPVENLCSRSTPPSATRK